MAFLILIPILFAVFATLGSVLMLVMPTAWASALVLVGVVGGIILLRRHLPRVPLPQNRGEWWFLILVTLVIALLLCWLIWHSFVVLPDGSFSVAHKAAPDVPYHLAQVTRIAFTNQWDFEEPQFSGEFIRYPYFINFISGALVKAGLPLAMAFHFPMILLALVDVVLMLLLLRGLGLARTLTILVIIGTLFGAGLGYIAYWQTHGQAGLPLRTGVPYPMQNISYPGMIPGFLVAQRPFLLGLGLFLTVLLFLLQGIKKEDAAVLTWAGIATGLMPFAHMYSFIAIVLIAIVGLAYLLIRRQPIFFDVVRGFVFPAFLLAVIPLMLWVLLPRFPLAGTAVLRLGWMNMPGETGAINLPHADAGHFLPWLSFMWTNFGFLLLVPFAAAWLAWRQKDIIIKIIALAALALWLIPNMLQLQSWDFDTNKFFAYAIFLSLIAVALIIQQTTRPWRRVGTALLAVVILFAIPSSLIATTRAFHAERVVTNTPEEQHIAQWLGSNTPDDTSVVSSVFLVDRLDAIQNPVVIASGRKATLGFKLWLFTHGIDYGDRLESLESFLKNPATGQALLKEIPADYLLIDPVMRQAFPRLEQQLAAAGYAIAAQSGNLTLVALKK